MLRKIGPLSLAVLLATALFSFQPAKEWFPAGNARDSYDMGIDNTVVHNGKAAATIQSKEPKIKGFGALMQECKADKYRGKKVKMSGYLKTTDVDGWAGFWLRIDKKGSNKNLAFDNMHNRKVKGTNDWTQFEIVLDVSCEASNMAYGVLLTGTGQVWFDDIQFEEVKPEVTIYHPMGSEIEQQPAPANLNFED